MEAANRSAPHSQDTARSNPNKPEAGIPQVIAGRYRVINRLGGGSFGDVYRVSDEVDGGRELALKILRSSDPVALRYFKREFRSLADVYHPNIARLYELVASEDRWLFTMELVDGVNFLQYLDRQLPEDREESLRSCLLQLAEGLETLHRRKLLHRDLKPSNVLVTSAGRVVILDFGLVRSFDEGIHSLVTLAGTPDYMAPEQGTGEVSIEASDWYAVGVMLYQSLTRRLPFEGNLVEVFHSKQFERPIPPADLVPNVSPELNELCVRLLKRDPARRGSYEDVTGLAGPGAYVQSRQRQRLAIVGRTEPLQRLNEALDASDDRPSVIHLCGPSGIGKTALLREFITRLRKDPGVLVFTGRCYESESIPYQALDDLIDHIGQYLRSLPQGHIERLLPRNFALLVRMFPVLTPFLANNVATTTTLNSVELRTRALSALRELFGRLNERHRVVLAIDDLQWGDLDGCTALSELFSSPDSPPIVGVLAYRSEDITSSPSLNLLRFGNASSNRKTTFINLDRFEIAECRDLAQLMLARTLEPEILHQIFEQSEGNPFLIHEIVRWMGQRERSTASGGRFSLTDVVLSRLNQLSSESRHFLELTAVAGQPTELPTLQLAGGTSDLLATRDELASNRLLRSRTVHGREEVEIYHDRLRATILAGMSQSVRELRHRELARALEAAGGRDSERIAAHYYQSRDFSLCAKYALKAARRASEVLAFHDAVRFFEMTLSTAALDPSEQRIVHCECADALANAGCGPQAAEHYFAAGDNATEDERLELNLRAAEELLYSGHIERGLAVLDMVLRNVGLELPRSGLMLPFDVLLRRLKLKIRGLKWDERQASDVPRKVLVKVDTCASAATGLGFVDVLRGAALQSTRLLLALEAGEPSRIARAMAMEAGYRSVAGASTEKETGLLLERARELSERTGDPRAVGLTAVMASTWSWNMGRWRECYDRACVAEVILHDRYERLTWERDTAALFKVSSLRWMGRWAEMKSILPGLIEDARSRGDLYLELVLQIQGVTSCELANDAPDRARAGLKVLEKWSNTGFHLEHLMETYNQVEISLYLGNGSQALKTVTSRWSALERSFMLRVQTLSIRMRSLIARAAVAAVSTESSNANETLLKLAEREIRKIKREGTGWGNGLAQMIQAGIESLRGQREEANASLTEAERLFEEADMKVHLAAARHSRGLLIGGSVGRSLVHKAESAMREEGIAGPDLISAMLAPGRFSF